MNTISTTGEGCQDRSENLLMAAIKSDDTHGPHILVADINTGTKTRLIFSTLEILQLFNWSHEVLRRNGRIAEDPYS